MNQSYKQLNNIVGWLVFAIAAIVYFLSAERTGSLWDCGEFIAGASKLQVVHPPGAPLFLLIGRMFTLPAELLSDDPAMIAFSVNLLSGISTAFAAMFVCWVATILSRLTFLKRIEEREEGDPDELTQGQTFAVLGAGLVAGLATAFCTSIWFSAVEGEVYAMSTFFTALTLWSVIKWYHLPDQPDSDRWLIFAVYAAGLSIGVHLLSLLTFPALALFYYFKKYKNHNLVGMVAAAGAGVAIIGSIQTFIITGIPRLWTYMDLFMVNGLGMPVHTGIIPTLLIVGGVIFFLLRYAQQNEHGLIQKIGVALLLVTTAFSTIGVVVIRANANTPINMNQPSDAMRLMPYINREQYGERPLLHGPQFDGQIVGTDLEDRYGLVDGKYEIVDNKAEYIFNPDDKVLFPRMGHLDEARKALYYRWMGHQGSPSFGDNMSFFFQYQIGWMYWRYFMWNFVGRQNGLQGFFPDDLSSGHWLSGIPFIDNMRLGDQTMLPDSMKNHEGRNTYYFLPLIFGLIGLLYHARSRQNEFLGLLALFIITGIGIIVYSNQPPNEPRERDYVLVGSFFTFCIWMGMAIPALYRMASERFNVRGAGPAVGIALLVLTAPVIMGFQNFDDHSRAKHSGARDYASNFLNSCAPNAIVFTYGDNDTYPLWYAQEIEGIRTDVRVVNLSLIAVDWYINQLRRKVNDSPAIKFSLTEEKLRGRKRVQIPIDPRQNGSQMSVTNAMNFLSESHPIPLQSGRSLESYFPTKKLYIPVNKQEVLANGVVAPEDADKIVDRIDFTLNKGSYMLKGDAAVLDIINSNIWDRPVYFAVTCRQESLMGLANYTQLEGLALRIVPIKSTGDTRQYGMVGNGRVAGDILHGNVVDKFRWGNFDKEDTFVDRSFGPTIQTTRVAILRATRQLLDEGKKDKAVELVDEFFAAFPHYNFPYDPNIMIFITRYLEAGATEKAKEPLRTLANETAQRLTFYLSLQDKVMQGYQSEAAGYNRVKDDILRVLPQFNDETLESEIRAMLAPFDTGAGPS